MDEKSIDCYAILIWREMITHFFLQYRLGLSGLHGKGHQLHNLGFHSFEGCVAIWVNVSLGEFLKAI
jgi:hypothetical protein